MSDRFGRKGKETGMRLLLTCATVALLALSACNAPEREPDDDDRTEQRGQDDDEE
ncbi:MAG: hypothetical protein IOC66_32380 [Burkholderia sp.]|jgi:hypothetical protein|uniref:hypothetical protein n=1 Tax=Bradyrhizobium sp. TaxID=376 RepID=UPI0025BECE84|nr:hypothetical protein [Bradyrhizobium sp.]MCA3580508.1 hypothetical protein [Bradyrhizobium sp.]MCA3796977.1 hypothetical protein [Burkholderia sp.]